MSSPPTFFIRQKSKNAAVYQVQPLKVVLPSPTVSGSQLLVVFEGQKSGFPFSRLGLNAQTSVPVISDNSNTLSPPVANTYTKLTGQILNLSQEGASTVALSPPFSPPIPVNSPPIVTPDASGFFPSVFAWVVNSPAVGTQTISVSAFYDDEFHSPPVQSPPFIGGRAVYDGGIQVQVYELAGLGGNLSAAASASGINITLLSAQSPPLHTAVFEVLVMMDSSVFSSGSTNANTVILDSGAFLGGSSYWAVQLTVGGAVGFSNPQQYPGAVLTIA